MPLTTETLDYYTKTVFMRNVTQAREDGYGFCCATCGCGPDAHESWCPLAPKLKPGQPFASLQAEVTNYLIA